MLVIVQLCPPSRARTEWKFHNGDDYPQHFGGARVRPERAPVIVNFKFENSNTGCTAVLSCQQGFSG